MKIADMTNWLILLAVVVAGVLVAGWVAPKLKAP